MGALVAPASMLPVSQRAAFSVAVCGVVSALVCSASLGEESPAIEMVEIDAGDVAAVK
jgi:hypothetical protein